MVGKTNRVESRGQKSLASKAQISVKCCKNNNPKKDIQGEDMKSLANTCGQQHTHMFPTQMEYWKEFRGLWQSKQISHH